jgi:hypothetical protein
MSESAGLTLISTQVKAVSSFSASNVSIGDWKVLNRGASSVYAIIRPGVAARPPLSYNVRDNNYRTVVEVWQRYKDDGTTMTDLLGHVDDITTRLDKYRKLADTTATIRDANVTGYGEVLQMWTNDGGASWLRRDVYVDWTEEESITYAE